MDHCIQRRENGTHLMLADLKAILAWTIGQDKTREVFTSVQLSLLMDGNQNDWCAFSPYRNTMRHALRRMHPTIMDQAKLEAIKLRAGKDVSKFIISFQVQWKEETASSWDKCSHSKFVSHDEKIPPTTCTEVSRGSESMATIDQSSAPRLPRGQRPLTAPCSSIQIALMMTTTKEWSD